MLLMAGTAIGQGTFTVGDFALFVSYLWFTTQVPSEIGTFYGDYKTQAVSIERLMELIRPEPPSVLVESHPIYDSGPLPEVTFPGQDPCRPAGVTRSAQPELPLPGFRKWPAIRAAAWKGFPFACGAAISWWSPGEWAAENPPWRGF